MQRYYSLHETIGLSVGAVFKSDAVLTFEQTLLQVVSMRQDVIDFNFRFCGRHGGLAHGAQDSGLRGQG